MTDSALVIVAITGFFIILLAGKSLAGRFVRKRVCVLCASVSLTWIVLLFLYYAGVFHNTVLLALLMGESVTGIYYLVERKVPKAYHLFRLPFLLTVTFAAYFLLDFSSIDTLAVFAIGVVWLLFGAVYLFRAVPRVRQIGEKIIACCKNW